MSRGRKAKTLSTGLDWEQIFIKSQGFYFQYITILLCRKNKKLTDDNANELLQKIKQEKEKLIAEKKIKNDKPLPEIKPEILQFEIPSNWSLIRLADICSQITDGEHQTPPRISEGRVLLSAKNIRDGFIDFENVNYISEENFQKAIKRCKPEKNDILLCCVGTIGRSSILEEEKDFAIVRSVALIKPLLKSASRFIKLALDSPHLQNDILERSWGTIQQSLYLNQIKELIIPFAPLDEQEMILDFLQDFGRNAIDENREYFDSEIENEVVSFHQAQLYNNQISTELNHQLALVKELRQAYLREAMQGKLVPQDYGDEPAEILLEKIKAEKEKLAAEKRIRRDKPLPPINAEEIPFEIPSNWTWCRLGELIELISGQHIDTTDYNERGEGFPYLTGPADFGEIYPIPTKWTTKPKVLANENDILITVKGSGVGKTNLSNLDKVVISRQLMAIRTNFISRIYLHFFLDSSFDLLQSEKKGTGIPGITRENILEKAFPLPPLAEQERIVAKLEKLMKFCDELEANIKQGTTNADQLLQTALKEALEPK